MDYVYLTHIGMRAHRPCSRAFIVQLDIAFQGLGIHMSVCICILCWWFFIYDCWMELRGLWDTVSICLSEVGIIYPILISFRLLSYENWMKHMVSLL